MLDIPYATRGETAGGSPGESPPPAPDPNIRPGSWHPRLVMAPVWRLDSKARLIKRMVDLTIALTGVLLCGVPAVCIAIAIRLESRGPVLFPQSRTGLNGNNFTMLKFRTMHRHNQLPDLVAQATWDDPRVTGVGRWLRRHSLDELPQLINVLRGEMSLVGPRPHARGTRAGGRLFEEVTDRYGLRHCVKPGMTGLAQVRGWRGETDTEEKLLRRLECDLEYIATWSVRLDFQIIWRTIGSVLGMRNAW